MRKMNGLTAVRRKLPMGNADREYQPLRSEQTSLAHKNARCVKK